MADPAPTVPVTTASSVGSLNAFAAAVAVNSVLVAIVLFIFLMIRPLLPKIYLPRFYILKYDDIVRYLHFAAISIDFHLLLIYFNLICGG
jgi:hypothetical protein